MQLRPHQERAVELLRDSLRKGNKRPILAAPCSFGKTITAAYMLSEAAKKGKRGFFFCDRVKLVQQALEAFDAQGLDVGVMQGQHQRTDYRAPIQIASIQTVARRPNIPEFDFAVVDECHVHYKSLQKIMDRYTAVPFIGLSATPYSKGLGLAYDDLIVPITPAELLDQGYLTPVDYFGGKTVDVSKVGARALKTGGTDYDPIQLAEATEKDLNLTGDIIKNWIKYAEGRQTIAFSPSIKHSRDMVDQFNEAGISAVHIDGYMDDEERQVIYRAHDRGEFLVLSCSRLLNVGYDAPKVSCLIDCFPTKSLITYVQRAGRIMRTAGGKENAIYLDHAGNVNRHGFAEFIVPDSLDNAEKRFNERSQAKKERSSNPINCPDCFRQFYGMRCVCGYTLPFKERIKTDGSELKKLEHREKKQIDRGQWLAELSLYAYYQGYKQGWAAHIYRQKFGCWPNRVTPPRVNDISPEVMGFIKHCQIRRAHAG
jgi:DNA repair protein RadD